MLMETFGNNCHQCYYQLICLRFPIVYPQHFVKQSEELLKVNELIMNILNYQVYFACFLEKLEDFIKSICSYFEISLWILLVASIEDLVN